MSSMAKPASTDHPIHELIRERWSPRAFADRPVSPQQLCQLLEAARWAASAYNDQPWYFLIAERSDSAEHQRMLSCLVAFNQAWARQAPVLALAVARSAFAHNGAANRHALYDTGQAVATLALQAAALGLQVHQMGGFDPELARRTYDIPEGYEAVTAVAIGYPGDPQTLPDELRAMELSERSRRPLGETVFAGRWQQAAPLVAAPAKEE